MPNIEEKSDLYYITEHNYVGPNQNDDKYVDADTIEISTTPAYTNSSREKRIEGWCGETNGWSMTAHGEYQSLEDAQAAVYQRFDEIRDTTPLGDKFESDDPNTVAVYKAGKFEKMSSQTTAAWCDAGIESDIAANTTDEAITKLISAYETAANSDGYTLDTHDLETFMHNRRKELQQEAAEQEE